MSDGTEGSTTRQERDGGPAITLQQPSLTHTPATICGPALHGTAHAPGEYDMRPAAVPVGEIAGGSTAPAHVVLAFDDSQAERRLVGKPVWFEFAQDGAGNVALGQITSVGAADGGSAAAGVRMQCGTMAVGSVFVRSGASYAPNVLGTLPAAGTPVFEADDEMVKEIVDRRKDTTYVGRFYGANAKFPVSLPPFAASGAGPYNIGVYGARGSGKSSLARTLIAAFAGSPASSVLNTSVPQEY